MEEEVGTVVTLQIPLGGRAFRPTHTHRMYSTYDMRGGRLHQRPFHPLLPGGAKSVSHKAGMIC